MRRLALVALMIALVGPAKAAGVAEVTIENVRVGLLDGKFANHYKSGTWTPVWVDLKAGPASFEGVVELTAPDDAGTPTAIRRAVSIKANEMATVTLYTRPGSFGTEMGMRVISLADRRTKANWTGNTISTLGPEVAMVLTGGQPQGVGDLSEMGKYNVAANNLAPRVVVSPVRPRDGWPGRWYGLDGVDAVVIDTNDPATMTRLREAESLFEWVRQGGHLVVAVGRNWQAVKDSPLAELLPGVPAGRVDLSDPGLIDQFAASGNKPLVPPGSKAKIQVTKFEDWESRGGIALSSSSVSPLVLRGPVGFGRVTMVGLDVDVKPFASWDEKKLFWDKLLDLRGYATDALNPNQGGNAFYRAGSNDLAASLHDSLERFPGVRLVPFGWVAFFVFLYILLIGPGDYLFLRKVVKRMEMTWITFPAIVITVSALAYAAAYYFKGTELRINKVDALDVDQTTGRVRGTTWLTLFSPQNQDYDLGIAPLPPEAEPTGDPVVSAKATPRSANVETLMTWFGAPENPYGGSGLSMNGGGYDYVPMSEPEQVDDVRVPIWSTKSFTGRWSGPLSSPLLEADLTPEGPDRLRGTVTNVSRRPMKNSALFFGRYVYVLNDLAPGATVTLGEAQGLAGYMDGVTKDLASRGMSYAGRPVVTPDDATAESERPDLVRALMFHSGRGAKNLALTSHALGRLDLAGQLDLRRPMLVAEVSGPATLLRLDGGVTKPKMAQTTLIRVILNLKAASPEKP